MWELCSTIWDSLSGILIAVPAALKNDLLFPHQPHSPEELIISKVRGQRSMIENQQDRLVYQTGVIREQSRGIRDLEDLLTQREKEIKSLKSSLQALEFELEA